MKIIYVPPRFTGLVKFLAVIGELITSLILLVLWPIKMMRFWAHTVLGFVALMGYLYLDLIMQVDNAHLIAVVGFVTVIAGIAFVKLLWHLVKRIEKFFIRIRCCPIIVSFTVRWPWRSYKKLIKANLPATADSLYKSA